MKLDPKVMLAQLSNYRTILKAAAIARSVVVLGASDWLVVIAELLWLTAAQSIYQPTW